MANYIIISSRGYYLTKRPGWGPRFTANLDDARRFNSISDAYEFRRNNLGGLGCKIARMGLYFNPPTIIC